MTARTRLGQRALNRALLGRQHLLSRTTMPALDLIEHLVGVQAQAPLAPYVGLWNRLDGFKPNELAELLLSRRAVRTWVMRSTIHLVSDTDALRLRPLVRPVLENGFTGHFGRYLDGLDVAAVVAAGTELLEERPRTRTELRELLGARWPDHNADALAYAVSYLTAGVQVTPRGVWGETGPAAITTVQSWLGRPLDPEPSIDDLVLRYLTAFGPAGVADVQLWSGLTRLREVVDRLPLRVYVDAAGNELYDVPDVVLPDPDTPAPVRFLPEYDNVLLSHADRTRLIPAGRRVPLPPGNGATTGTVLIDGTFDALWKIRRAGGGHVVQIDPYRKLTPAEQTALADEARRLVGFVATGTSSVDIEFHPPS